MAIFTRSADRMGAPNLKRWSLDPNHAHLGASYIFWVLHLNGLARTRTRFICSEKYNIKQQTWNSASKSTRLTKTALTIALNGYSLLHI